jgi:hypothetical protein
LIIYLEASACLSTSNFLEIANDSADMLNALIISLARLSSALIFELNAL